MTHCLLSPISCRLTYDLLYLFIKAITLYFVRSSDIKRYYRITVCYVSYTPQIYYFKELYDTYLFALPLYLLLPVLNVNELYPYERG